MRIIIFGNLCKIINLIIIPVMTLIITILSSINIRMFINNTCFTYLGYASIVGAIRLFFFLMLNYISRRTLILKN